MNKLSFAALVVLAGCAGTADVGSDDGLNDEGSNGSALTLSATQQQQLLDLVNYPATDLTTLEVNAGLESRSAKAIITARNGADGVSPSGDDFFFTSVAQVDAVPNVGDASLTRLAAYAAAHPAPSSATVKGVLFKGWQAEAVLYGVNTSTQAELDALLDSRAVTSMMTNRPLRNVTQLGSLSYVGATALAKLIAQSATWWGQEHGGNALAGTFDGVAFDEHSAEIALQIANQATLSQMSGNGVPAAPAAAIVGNRPYSTLTQVAAVGGVGTATMKGLLAYAQSGKWGAGGATSCVDTFTAAVGPHLGDLLFMSESDRPLNVVSFPGAGAMAATGTSLMALVGAPAGSRFEQRDPSNYYVDFEPNSSTSDPNAGAAVQAAIAAQLTDVVYIAIIPPVPNEAQVDVYLVGRTSCGDLVGLHAISIET